MTNTENKPSNRTNKPLFFEQFTGVEKSRLEEMWELSNKGKTFELQISNEDIENALNNVHRKLDFPSRKSGEIQTNKKLFYLAAAILIIAMGVTYIFFPVTHQVSYGDIQTVQLPDGSTVELNSGSELRYNRLFFIYNRDVTLNGEAFFSVANGTVPFRVFANGSTVEVTGTRFNVRSWKDDPDIETTVAVTEGSVIFYPVKIRKAAVELESKTTSLWSPKMDEPSAPTKIDPELFLAWRNRSLAFNRQSLVVIFRELERKFDIRIQFNATGLESDTLSTFFSGPLKPDEIIKDICMVKGLRYSKTNDGFRIYK